MGELMMKHNKIFKLAILVSIATLGMNFLSIAEVANAHRTETQIKYEDEVSSSSENEEKTDEERNNTDAAGEKNASENEDTSDNNSDEKILGDVNSDGKVTADDAEILSEYIKGNINCSDLDLSVADVNRDRRIDQRDCINICRYVDGKRCSPGIGRKLSDLASGTTRLCHEEKGGECESFYRKTFTLEGADKILDYYRASKGAFLCIQKIKRILHYGYIIKQSL